MKRLRALWKLFTFDRTFWLLALASFAILANWAIFLLGTALNLVVEVAMGYFLNPLVVALLGVFVLKEKLRPLQWVAVAISAIAVGYLVVTYGQFPWIGLGITVTFASYSLLKRVVGAHVGAIEGMTLETILMIPAAVIILVFVGSTSGIVWGTLGPVNTFMLVMIGVATAVPLILFAASARLIPLVTIAMLQFVSPVLTFSTGVFILQEEMPLERWVGFIMIWIAILIVIFDTVRNGRRTRRNSAVLLTTDLV